MKSHAIQTKIARHITLILVALFLAGCSGPPSESVGKQIVEKEIQDKSKGLMKLVSFRKTNATGGDGFYVMEYEVEVAFTDDATVPTSAFAAGPFFADRGFTKANQLDLPLSSIQKRKGETMKRASTLTFKKTEKGWRGPDGNVY
jgi:hypothetical protein